MASMISFLILLLATYSYSAPFQQAFETSTSGYEFTTGTTIVEHENSFNMRVRIFIIFFFQKNLFFSS
jgi:hypothetical protein